jgi:hypothetical protein
MKRMLVTLAMLLPLTAALLAQPGTPVKVGRASFTFGDTQVDFGKVSGSIMQSGGYTVVSVFFSKDGNPSSDRLGIGLMVQKPGPVDLNQPMGNGIDYRIGGTFYKYEKGKSQCTMTVTKLTPTTIEGTAECPLVNEPGGSGKTNSLTSVKFFATTATGSVN